MAKKAKGKARLTIDDALVQYVETSDVITGALDQKELKSVGRGILSEARAEHGPV